MDLNQNFVDLTDEELSSYAAEVRAAFDALAALDTPTVAQIEEAEALADHLDAVNTEATTRVEAAEALAERADALRNRFPDNSQTETEDEDDAVDDEDDDAAADVVEGEVLEVKDEPVPAAARSRVATLAKRTKRPAAPAPASKPVTITAAADVPEFATGSKIDDMVKVGEALVNRMRGFSPPTGDGTSENLQHYGVASFHVDFPKDLTVGRGDDEMSALFRARDEKRLPGGSLVAAGGWCAPSETIYDLCPGGTLDGLVSLPEINISRGGIRYTQGPDFSDLYDNAGFCQTEAQAIAGTTKPCFEIDCPTFVEVRLQACGICIKIPILTQVGYPELIAAYLSEAMVAHQHFMNAKVLADMATALGAPVAYPGLGSSSSDTFETLLLAVAQIRQNQRLSLNESVEVVVPFWAKDLLKADLYRRSAWTGAPPTDGDVTAIFAAASASVQFVYDWNELPTGTDWPDTIPALVYPAGTFVKGVADVINLNAVYDAASLAVNTYTGLFFEQGYLLAQMCRDGVAITVPVCNAGRTGASDLTCAVTP